MTEEIEDSRLNRTPTHSPTIKDGPDQLKIGFEIFHYRGGAPPHRGYHWLKDDVLTIPVTYGWADLSSRLKQEIDAEDYYNLRFGIYKDTAKGRDEKEINDTIGISIQQAFEEGGYHLRVYQPMRRGYVDIGVFVPMNTGGEIINLLHENISTFSNFDQLISSFAPSASLCNKYTELPPLESLSSDALDNLKRHANLIYTNKLARGEVEKECDLQISLKREELLDFIGYTALKDLDELFGQRCEDIVLRRCNKIGHFIDFHLDYSNKTMQVAVVDDSEYDGGKLAYLVKSEDDNDARVEIPRRKKGSITIHDNGVIHGVTPLSGGVRYGLLVLERGFIVPGTR